MCAVYNRHDMRACGLLTHVYTSSVICAHTPQMYHAQVDFCGRHCCTVANVPPTAAPAAAAPWCRMAPPGWTRGGPVLRSIWHKAGPTFPAPPPPEVPPGSIVRGFPVPARKRSFLSWHVSGGRNPEKRLVSKTAAFGPTFGSHCGVQRAEARATQ